MSRIRLHFLFSVLTEILLVSGASAPAAFRVPESAAVDSVNALVGNGGDSPNGSGGMIPSVAPPFGMTRWTAQTRQNYVSVTPYNYTDTKIHGFQGTHQPAIWMGESGQIVVVPGTGYIRDLFEERGMAFSHDDEVITPSYYSVRMNALEGKGQIFAEMSATSRVSHLRFTFPNHQPYVLLSASRPTTLTSDDPSKARDFFPNGTVSVNPAQREICGSNDERQDWIIGPVSTPASGFKGYFCARFDAAFTQYGVAQNGSVFENQTEGKGTVLSAFAGFSEGNKVVNVRVGTSFISIDQARKNLDSEVPDGTTLEETAKLVRTAWAEKLDRIQVKGQGDREVLYTSAFHALQYPYEQHEGGRYYSGYDDTVHQGESYTGYSIWDTYRAEWAWLILMAPERVPGMITSMLQDYKEGGWLPMWKNIIETNIMVGTHADSLIAEAIVKGVTDFDVDLAWEAVLKDATVPPVNDHNTSYSDREEGVDYEVRAGLSTVYAKKGWVASDIHSEAGSRTLDYAYDDYAVAVMAKHLNKPANVSDFYFKRAMTAPFTMFNDETGFMEARFANGSWAGEAAGWTEGDKWAYSFDVVHDVAGLIEKRGGREKFVQSLEDHFNGGHNDHTNEPSHHIPYLYALAGRADKTQERVREIARSNYNATVNGLSGNEDCGQMSAWYLFTALGFYPVDPVSGEYVVGTPFFDQVTLHLPGVSKPLVISAPGASGEKVYVKSLRIEKDQVTTPIISHEQISNGGNLVFEMSGEPEKWACHQILNAELRAEENDGSYSSGHEEL